MDNEMITQRNNWEHTCPDRPNYKSLCRQSITTQEYIFGEFLNPQNQNTSVPVMCPSIILHLGTNVHDMGRRSSRQYRYSVLWMFSVIEEYLDELCPDTVYYWSTASQLNEALVPEQFKCISANSKIIEFNDIARSTLVSMNHTRMLVGFDQYEYSLQVPSSKYHDAVHFKDAPYQHIAKSMLAFLGLT